MIKKIKSIGNLAVFQSFEWDKEVHDEKGNVREFSVINIVYGRNYSGKTSLSRIVRAMETGKLSDKYQKPSFCVTFNDGSHVDQNALTSHGKKIRVFNEDFVRENLRFITNPDDSIEPFAILGDDNNKIEKEIEALERELGHREEGKETALYDRKVNAIKEFNTAKEEHDKALNVLDKQLGDKATDRKIGIKYKPERFGDQNYTKPKLENDIKKVLNEGYQTLSNKQQDEHEKLINEKTLDTMPLFQTIELQFQKLSDETYAIVTKKISESDKIEELVKDAVLNRWVSEGRGHHQGKRDHCAFCGNHISKERWEKLNKHFDEESEKLEKDIDGLITRIASEQKSAFSALKISKELFYSIFHQRLDSVIAEHTTASNKYCYALESLLDQLRNRKDDIINSKDFVRPDDCGNELKAAWSSYETIRTESNNFTDSLSSEQSKAREALRLREVSDFLATINYQDQLDFIENLKKKRDETERNKNEIDGEIRDKEALLESKKRELNDEEKGALKVNEYLNNFFGHNFLSLEAKKDLPAEPDSKRIRFEIIRDGKKAYHLSEGECSLLALCYFLAKLGDIGTKDSKPIIWIDDPISSLDANHIFFVYSLLNAEVVSSGKFEQLFISTHNLDFLKYLKRLNGKFLNHNNKMQDYGKEFFVVTRNDKISTISAMPKYLKEYVTEFNYLFHQIYRCAAIEVVDDSNYTMFYNFGNNARKFLEIFLYYKYPDKGMNEETLRQFFGDEKVPAVLIDRINNEYSHLCGVFERGAAPVEVPEMKTAAQQIINRLKADSDQYNSLLQSIGVVPENSAVIDASPQVAQ